MLYVLIMISQALLFWKLDILCTTRVYLIKHFFKKKYIYNDDSNGNVFKNIFFLIFSLFI